MAITYSIAPNPHWIIIDDFSKLPAGAAIYTYSHLNPSQYKPAYQDPAGEIIYTQPIDGFGNGTFAPIYWQTDSTNPDDSYYIEVWSARKENAGVLLWTFDGLTGSNASGGGGGGTTVFSDIQNLVVNGEFYRNTGNQSGAVAITLAPSNNAGIGGYANNINDGPPSPDIIFAKSNTSATDAISYQLFTQGATDLSPNPTPQYFVRYSCTGAGSAEAYKYFQFPLVKGLQNTSNQNMSVKIYARSSGSTTGVQLYFRQFFGNGTAISPSADVKAAIGVPLALTPAFQPFIRTSIVVPSIATKTIGDCRNDTLYMQIGLPLNITMDIDFILPSCYFGARTSNIDFDTLDEVDSIISLPRTGDIRTTLNSFLPGWVLMNDGTIGNSSSSATARANDDTFFLYDLIWTAISDALAPVSGGRGASSVADFSANKTITLTRNLGRVMAGALPVAANQAFTRAANTITMTSTAAFYTGMAVTVSGGSLPTPLAAGTIYYAIVVDSTTMSLANSTANALAGTVITLTGAGTGTIVSLNVETLGSYIGEESHIPTISEMAAHTHPATSAGGQFIESGGASTGITPANANATIAPDTGTMGGGIAFNIIQPTSYMNIFVKL